jgi:hypothetical protein
MLPLVHGVTPGTEENNPPFRLDGAPPVQFSKREWGLFSLSVVGILSETTPRRPRKNEVVMM